MICEIVDFIHEFIFVIVHFSLNDISVVFNYVILEYWCTLVGSMHDPLLDLYAAAVLLFGRMLLEW